MTHPRAQSIGSPVLDGLYAAACALTAAMMASLAGVMMRSCTDGHNKGAYCIADSTSRARLLGGNRVHMDRHLSNCNHA